MDRAILNTLGVFEAELDEAGLSHNPPLMEETNSRILRTDFNTFHAAPSPRPFQEPPVDQEAEYKRGLLDGETQTRAVYESTIATMQAALLEVQETFSKHIADVEAGHMAAIGTCFLAIAPRLAEGAQMSELIALLKTITAPSSSGIINITCGPDQSQAIERLCATLPKGQSSSIQITPVDEMQGGTISVEWASGGASLDHKAIALAAMKGVTALLPDMISQTSFEDNQTIEAEVTHDI